ncbi:MAG: hypothetical protein ACI3X1_03530 [Eubacteriales bacterium]
MDRNWHVLKLKEIERQLNTDLERGLSTREARVRLDGEKKRDGGERRSLFVPRKSNYFKVAVSLLLTPQMLILIAVSLLAAIFGETATGALVLLVTLVGGAVCGAIAQNSQRKLDLMRGCASPCMRVRRGGGILHTDGANLVAGDIVEFSRGDVLPCDVRLISSRSLKVKELIHTKDGIRNRIADKNHEKKYSPDDACRHPNAENMVYAGSAVIDGSGVAVVVGSGAQTYLSAYCRDGQLSGEISAELQGSRLEQLLYQTAFALLGIVAVISLLGIITLEETSLISNFLLLLSSVSTVSIEVCRTCKKSVFSSCVEGLTKSKKTQNDKVAYVRDIKALETLTNVTDIVLLGRAAFTDGICHVGSVYTAEKSYDALKSESDEGRRLMTYIYAYLRAADESRAKTELVLDGVIDSLFDYLKASGFDKKGADLVLRSLYFAADSSGESGYACAETPENEYRVLLSLDRDILSFCRYSRGSDGACVELSVRERGKIYDFADKAEKKNGKCLFVMSETGGETVFEGAISLYEKRDTLFETSISDLKKMGIRVTAMLQNEDDFTEFERMYGSLSGEKVAFASEFKEQNKDIVSEIGNYGVYAGFALDEYAHLLCAMRERGGVIATYGIDDSLYEVMAKADISVSCDTVNFPSAKYRESSTEKLPHSGRDTNIRCSSQTRMLSRLLVHRANAGGGGLSSVENAIKASRGAVISSSVALLYFCALICSLLPFALLPSILGIELLGAVQAACMSLVIAILSISAFVDCEPKSHFLFTPCDHVNFELDFIKSRKISLIARVLLNVCFVSVLKILDVFEVFGERASYSMPIFLSLIFAAAAELFLMNSEFFKRGEGRRLSWVKFLAAYGALLLLSGIITQDYFRGQFFPNGYGTFEFIILPVYCLLYSAMLFIIRTARKRRNRD